MGWSWPKNPQVPDLSWVKKQPEEDSEYVAANMHVNPTKLPAALLTLNHVCEMQQVFSMNYTKANKTNL